jgi:hypothetical protein
MRSVTEKWMNWTWMTPCLCVLACGDAGGGSADGTTTQTPTVTVPTATDGSTADTPTDGGSNTDGQTGTDSATDSATTAPTSPTTADAETTVGTADTTAGETGFLPGCGEDPPPGFMVPFDDQCAVMPSVGAFNPVVEWHKATWVAGPESKSSVSAPVVAQLTDDDGDGEVTPADMPDVLVITYNDPSTLSSCWLRAVSGDGTTEIFSVQNAQFSRNENLSVGDIDGDGLVEIVTKAKDQKVYAYEHDGTLKWTSPDLGAHTGIYDSTVSISDMNGDGQPELVTGRAILDNTGALLGAGTHGIGVPTGNSNADASMSFAVDINGDGEQEVIVGNAAYNLAGADVWFNMQEDGFPGTLDLEADGMAEIVVVSNAKVRVQTGVDGTVLWDVPVPGGLGGPPTVADFDGDGLPEIGVAGVNLYSVFDGDGSVLWSATTQDASSGITGSSVYDFEGDGIADVVYADERDLWVFSGLDGAVKLQFAEHNSGTRLEQPVVADVDGDDEVEIIFVSESYGGAFGTVDGITVIGDLDHSWRPGRKIWNQHAYHITNVNDDGTIPAAADLNWLTYNNFRSGDLSPPDGLSSPDIQLKSPESCINTCKGDGLLEVWVQIGNVGAVPLTAGAKIEVHGTMNAVESLLKTVPFADVLQPGQFADAIVIEVDAADYQSLRLVAVPNEAECKEDGDNEIILEQPFCMAPG